MPHPYSQSALLGPVVNTFTFMNIFIESIPFRNPLRLLQQQSFCSARLTLDQIDLILSTNFSLVCQNMGAAVLILSFRDSHDQPWPGLPN